jgi:peptidoglycan/xylan/chitin deacetylase (PgdA/CDA1 family)
MSTDRRPSRENRSLEGIVTMTGTRWPAGKKAAVSITMDNMGEAAEIYRGSWPDNRTVGSHHSVTRDLPRMLKVLDQFGVHATYFVEGWNTGIYPDAIRAVRKRGHEMAFHGWQHEPWASLTATAERDLFERSLKGFSRLNLTMRGFRPPGGRLTAQTPSLLREFEFTYCSPAGSNAAILDDTVYLPFEWQGIDAYYYSDAFADLRGKKGDQERPMEPGMFVDRVLSLLEDRLATQGYTATLFHPFLENEEFRIEAMSRIVEHVVSDDRIWCAPGHEVAAWVRSHEGEFSDVPDLDLTTWSR